MGPSMAEEARCDGETGSGKSDRGQRVYGNRRTAARKARWGATWVVDARRSLSGSECCQVVSGATDRQAALAAQHSTFRLVSDQRY